MDEEAFRRRIIELLENINERIRSLEKSLEGFQPTPGKKMEAKAPLDVDVLLSLPDHLRKTAMVVSERGTLTAEEVASETRRTRAAESDYLNQLVKMGYLSKERKGRTIYFHS